MIFTVVVVMIPLFLYELDFIESRAFIALFVRWALLTVRGTFFTEVIRYKHSILANKACFS
jgi:hypothetical protein